MEEVIMIWATDVKIMILRYGRKLESDLKYLGYNETLLFKVDIK